MKGVTPMKKLIALAMAALLLCCSALAEGSNPAVSANVYKTECIAG